MIVMLQIAFSIAVLGYLRQRQAYLRRRNRQSWDTLIVQSRRYPRDSASAWIRLQHARIAMEMADYAERNCDAGPTKFDRVQLASMRRDAMEMRLASLRAILGIAALQPAS